MPFAEPHNTNHGPTNGSHSIATHGWKALVDERKLTAFEKQKIESKMYITSSTRGEMQDLCNRIFVCGSIIDGRWMVLIESDGPMVSAAVMAYRSVRGV